MIRRDDIPLGYSIDKDGNVTSYKALDGSWREYRRDPSGMIVEFRSSMGEYYVYSLHAPSKDILGISVAKWCAAVALMCAIVVLAVLML